MASLSATTAGRPDSLSSFDGLRRDTRVLVHGSPRSNAAPSFRRRRAGAIRASASSPRLNGRRLHVAVFGGGPAGGSAAEALAKGGVEAILIERKLDNCKPCGGAIPLCMVDEFSLPLDLIDRRVTKMKMISPSNVAVDIGRTLAPHEYIGMVRREVLDAYLRDRAASAGASIINGLFLRMDPPESPSGSYTIHYTEYIPGSAGGQRRTAEVDAIVGADGANSRVAKSIGAWDYEFAIAFQEDIRRQDGVLQGPSRDVRRGGRVAGLLRLGVPQMRSRRGGHRHSDPQG